MRHLTAGLLVAFLLCLPPALGATTSFSWGTILKGHRLGTIAATGTATDEGIEIDLAFDHGKEVRSSLKLTGKACGGYLFGEATGTYGGKEVAGRFRAGWTGVDCAPIEGLTHAWAQVGAGK